MILLRSHEVIEANDQPVQNTDYLQRYACKKIKYVTTLCLKN